MIEKIGSVKNPLTIIAIFAGIAEVSGTSILPFIKPETQAIFIYFLIIFPIALILLFFITLNFNNKALYAPSDFNNEENYIKIFQYDISKQQNVELTVSYDVLFKKLNSDFKKLEDDNNEKFIAVETEIKKILSLQSPENSDVKLTENTDREIFNMYYIYIAQLKNYTEFEREVEKLGYRTRIYESFDNEKISENNNEAIWLGSDIPLKMAQEVLTIARQYFPWLKYVKISLSIGPDYIFIGGSSHSATSFLNLKPMNQSDFNQIQTFKSKDKLHEYINRFDRSTFDR